MNGINLTCAAHGKNFLKTMLRLAQKREEFRIVADQYGVQTGCVILLI